MVRDVPFHVVPAFVIALLGQSSWLPPGGYALPDLCARLSQETHQTFSPGALADYPVYLSLKDPRPERVKSLVAQALRATWTKTEKGWRLEALKANPKAEVAEFIPKYRAATQKLPILAQLPAERLALMNPGEIRRFSSTPGPLVEHVKFDQPCQVIARRTGTRAFEFRILNDEREAKISGEGAFWMSALSSATLSRLSKSLHEPLLSPKVAEVARIAPLLISLSDANIRHSADDRFIKLSAPYLDELARHAEMDVCVALSDTILPVFSGSKSTQYTVKQFIEQLEPWVDISISKNLLVASLPEVENRFRVQSKRDVINRLSQVVQRTGFASLAVLGDYLAQQRPGATESWTDLTHLVSVGVDFDSPHTGDYPYNLRLGAAMSVDDWELLSSHKQVRVMALSRCAQQQVQNILLNSRCRIGQESEDPVRWPMQDPGQLVVRAQVESTPLLVCRSPKVSQILTPEQAASVLGTTLRNGPAPLKFAAVTRYHVSLQIGIDNSRSITTGFSMLTSRSDRFVNWQQLPEELQAPFREEFVRPELQHYTNGNQIQ